MFVCFLIDPSEFRLQIDAQSVGHPCAQGSVLVFGARRELL